VGCQIWHGAVVVEGGKIEGGWWSGGASQRRVRAHLARQFELRMMFLFVFDVSVGREVSRVGV
jgi:hypothetical protein